MPSLLRRLLAGSLVTLVLASHVTVFAVDNEEGLEPTPRKILYALREFETVGSVLHVGAHPDDENTQLITYLARGRGYRAAYLSLTRGDGGQNELGRDFDEKLGVARTQELLAARKLDHGKQFFTRAIDFGFSKSPEETLQFWDRDQVLADVVRVIRQFRPDVVVTRFPIPPGSGGHGHHTASAILAVEAFKLAGDPNAYPEQLQQGLTVWQPKRVVWNGFGARGGASGLSGPTFEMDIGGNDPVTGEALGTVANESRGMHKTQSMGGFSGRTSTGPNMQTFMLLGGSPGDWPGQTPAGQQAGTVRKGDLMDGVDTTWNRLPGGAAIAKATEEIIAKFDGKKITASVPALLKLRKDLAAFPSDAVINDKRAQLDRIIQECLSLDVDTTVESAEIVPGETVKLHYALVYTVDKKSKITVEHLGVRATGLEKVTRPAGLNGKLQSGRVYTGDFEAVLPEKTPFSQPYWLRADGAAGISTVENPLLIGLPENPPVVTIQHVFRINDQEFILTEEPKEVTQNATGEHQRRIDVIPPASLAFSSEIFLIAPGKTKTVTVHVAAVRDVIDGEVKVGAPDGWQVTPATQPFKLIHAGGKSSFNFEVTAPSPGSQSTPAPANDAKANAGRLTASVKIDGHSYSTQRQEIRYDHIPLQLLQPPARSRLVSFELGTKGKTIGYLPGAGDYVAECLEQMGYTVRTLNSTDLSMEKLKDIDTVVIGVRAFNERKDLAEGLPNLAVWVAAGGTVIAQYNRPNGLQVPDIAPYPLSIQGSAPALRVTDEKSPFTFLAPNHPALNTPNKITPADFDGWVQERGAYFPSTWDEKNYQTILAFNDPGEKPLTSGVLIGKVGKGYYVYTSLAFFRQLPAGVPGAYRLFANLVSLGKQ